MGIRIIEDVSAGSTYSFDKNGGYCTRIFHVSGLPGGDKGSQQNCYLAATARDYTTGAGIPVYGQSHPTIPGIFSQGGSAEPAPPDSRLGFKVTVPYSWQSFAVNSVQVKISGVRSVIHTNRNLDTGEILVVNYQYFTKGVKKNAQNMVQFDVFSNHINLEISRIETASPKVKAANYAGKVNSDAGWQGVGKAFQWLCQSIEGDKQTGSNWNVTYVFEYAPEGWGQLGFYQDNSTHLIPSDVLNSQDPKIKQPITTTGQLANGIFSYVPASAAFSSLGLPNV